MGSTELKSVYLQNAVVCIGSSREKTTQKFTPTSHQTYKLSQSLYALEHFFNILKINPLFGKNSQKIHFLFYIKRLKRQHSRHT